MAKREYIQANKDWLAEMGYGKFSLYNSRKGSGLAILQVGALIIG